MTIWEHILSMSTSLVIGTGIGALLASVAKDVLLKGVEREFKKDEEARGHALERAVMDAQSDIDGRLTLLESNLEERRAQASEVRAEERDRRERKRVLLERLAISATEAIVQVGHRINNITEIDLNQALRPNFAPQDGWSMTHEYAMDSTLYAFARYFAAIQRIQHELGADVFEDEQRRAVLRCFHEASSPLSSFPLAEIAECSAPDAQVFSLQQLAIGEAVLHQGAGPLGVMTYFDFLAALAASPQLRAALEPLRQLLEKAEPGSKVERRLVLFGEQLATLRGELDRLLTATPSHEKASAAANALLRVQAAPAD